MNCQKQNLRSSSRVEFILNYVLFEKEVMLALKKANIFTSIEQQRKITFSNNNQIVLNGIAHLDSNVSFVIDIKMSKSLNIIQDGIIQLKRNINILLNDKAQKYYGGSAESVV